MRVALRQASTGNFKFVDTGWSWSIFMGAGFLGLPLFFRGLALWGTVMMVLWFLQFGVPFVMGAAGDTLELLLNFVVFGACLYLGFQGNALSARHLFACGYDFAKPDSFEARDAAERWGV